MSVPPAPAPPIVVLTDEAGNPRGTAGRLEAHTGRGLLHKAFSVFVFRPGGELLIQQRSREKMLWPLYWANTCCSHPRVGEDLRSAAGRRLEEDCGLTCALQEVGSFVYRAEEPSGRGVEHEHDTVLVGWVEGDALPRTDPAEVAAWRWVHPDALEREIAREPGRFAPWFAQGLAIAVKSPPPGPGHAGSGPASPPTAAPRSRRS